MRCYWVTDDPIYIQYHDHEWGRPVVDDVKLLEFLILEGQQAGLNWLTILKKRESMRAAYAAFDPYALAAYSESDVASLLVNPGIIRNRRKVAATLQNAKAYIKLIQGGESFSEYLWHFVGGETRVNAWSGPKEVPVMTDQSKQMSRDLKKRGFSFVGPTICYAFMQAVGMVWDHTTDCDCYEQFSKLGRRKDED